MTLFRLADAGGRRSLSPSVPIEIHCQKEIPVLIFFLALVASYDAKKRYPFWCIFLEAPFSLVFLHRKGFCSRREAVGDNENVFVFERIAAIKTLT